MNILAIGAHPDDVEISCAGTLHKYKSLGHTIFIALATSGNAGSNTHDTPDQIGAVREAEQLEAAKLLDAQVQFLRFDDERLLDTAETRRDVLNAMRWADPDVILTHNPEDPSPDHAMTGRLVSNLIISLPGKLIPTDAPPVTKRTSLFYWETTMGINFLPEVYVDITDFMPIKLQAISKHKSQLDWMKYCADCDLLDSFETVAKFRGLQAGYKYAEAFRAFRIHSYMPDFSLLP